MVEVVRPDILVPIGRALLFGSLGVVIFHFIRGHSNATESAERLVLAVLAMALFAAGVGLISSLAKEAETFVEGLAGGNGLRAFLGRLMKLWNDATDSQKSGASRLAAGLAAIEVWRGGLWGILSLIVDAAFLIVMFLLKITQGVMWNLIIVFIPIACGLFPVMPRMLTSMTMYAIEISLWLPIGRLVDWTTGEIARHYMTANPTDGVFLIGSEILAIILIWKTPQITHRLVTAEPLREVSPHGVIQGFVLGRLTAGTRVVTKHMARGFRK